MEFLLQLLSPTEWVLLIVTGLLGWTIYGIIYRFYLHPLARFPGPKLAIATYWYEFYYDIFQDGQYTWKLRGLHEKYGPIIRINPDELHINDPDYYDEVFNNSGAKVEKPFREANSFGPFPAAIGTVQHDLHRLRRGALNAFFSKRSVNNLAPYIQTSIDKLCSRFEQAIETGERINLKHAYAAFTSDVIREYCFSRSPDAVLTPDFNARSHDDLDVFMETSLLTQHLPWMMAALYSLPDWILRRTSRAMAEIMDERQSLSIQVEDIRSEKNKSYETSGHPTVFHSLIESQLPLQEKSRERLRDEAFSLVTAGSLTTAHLFKTLTYHIAANADVRDQLVRELRTVMPAPTDRPSLLELEHLPCLTAVIHEGLRISHGVSHRLMRSFPEKALNYRGAMIPPGTTVCMTSLLIHEDEHIFPDPKTFRPERWLGEDQKKLLRYLTPFSRGTRACVGINLTWAEMYLGLASVFRRFDFDLAEVVRERDVDCVRDYITAAPARGSKGIIVKVLSVPD